MTDPVAPEPAPPSRIEQEAAAPPAPRASAPPAPPATARRPPDEARARAAAPGLAGLAFASPSPGERHGTSDDGLVWLDGRWARFPRPRRDVRAAPIG